MSEFSRTLIDRSGYEAEGFAEIYDRCRPSPPPDLLEILMVVAQVKRPRLVVDLGAGTGLSTRVWAERAEEVIGVEANAFMVERARLATRAPNVRYVEAFAAETGLDESSADLVTCAQAFHWMEPAPVLAEAARILRRGGAFAIYDYDVPPVVHPEVDDAFAAHFEARRSARKRLGLQAGAVTWPKERHLERIRESGGFRFARSASPPRASGERTWHSAAVAVPSLPRKRLANSPSAPRPPSGSSSSESTCSPTAAAGGSFSN